MCQEETCEENLHSFVSVLEALTPLRVELTKDRKVLRSMRNIVKPEGKEIAVEPSFKKALFKVELIINPQIAANAAKAEKKEEKKEPLLHFAYKTDLLEFKKAVLNSFEKGMGAFRDVHSIESVLLPHLIRDHHLDPIFSPSDAWELEQLRLRLEELLVKQEPWLQDILEALESFKDDLTKKHRVKLNRIIYISIYILCYIYK